MYSKIKKIKNASERNRIVERLLLLRDQLDRQVPAKTATDTLLLATWNIRAFGDNRCNESLQYIAEIVSRFDLVAVQEVAANLDGLQKLVVLLGPNWDYIVTDSTEGTACGGERMAFIFDRCKVFFRKMAGEIVLPQTKLIEKTLQFARTPFCVAFQAGWFRFILTSVHIYYGTSANDNPRRVEEITSIAKFLNDRAKKDGESYILLGDFNIFDTTDATMNALKKQGFYVPDATQGVHSDLGNSKHYDQIAFKLKLDVNMTVFSEGKQRAGVFDFTETIYRPQDLDLYREYFDEKYVKDKTEKQIQSYYLTNWRTFQMSDHLPLWIELKIDFSNQFLKNIFQPTQETSALSASNTGVVEKTAENQSELSYVGNKNSKTFHLASCRSLPAEESRVYFDSQQVAINAGYKSCGICKP
jgi:endonuclease/exonuclease/phosphatase family metal-dependent hydrolase